MEKGFRGTISIKEWFFNKVNEECKKYGMILAAEYKYDEDLQTSVCDRSKMRIDNVLAETEKAYKVVLDAETFGGAYKGWQTWIPKSVIIG